MNAEELEREGLFTTRRALASVTDSLGLSGSVARERSISLRRTVDVGGDDGIVWLRVGDTLGNVRIEPASLSLLHRLTIGAPLVTPRSRVLIDTRKEVARGPHDVPGWSTLPDPVARTTEAVFEHRGLSQEGGFAHAATANATRDLGAKR